RVSADGTPAWAANGVQLTAAFGNQKLSTAAPDGAGGAIVVWEDWGLGFDNLDIYAQRVLADGTVAWTGDGVSLCSAPGNQRFPVIVPDRAGGAYAAWEDTRSGTESDIFAQRVIGNGNPVWTFGGVALCAASGAP